MTTPVNTSLDASGFLKQYDALFEDILKAYQLGDKLTTQGYDQPECIAVCGMGGSAIAGNFLATYFSDLGSTVQVRIIRTYHLPTDLPKKTLYVVLSDSGNTEETISLYRDIAKFTKQVVSFSVGGRLEQMAKGYRLQHLTIPGGYQPRTAALSYIFLPLLRFVEKLGLVPDQSEEIAKLRKEVQRKELRTLSEHISEKLVDTVPLIYASEKYYPVAYRMKTELNENAKVHAFCHSYSELNHNEMLGFTDLKAKFHIITFIFDDDHRRVKTRMELTKEITNRLGVATTEIKLSGPFFLAKFYSGIILGDLIAYYLALRYGRDPSPVTLIEEFKQKLGPFA